MVAASCQFGSINETTLPGSARSSIARARVGRLSMQSATVDARFSVHDEQAIGGLFRSAVQSVTQSLPSPPAFRVSDPRALFVPADPPTFDQPSPFHRP